MSPDHQPGSQRRVLTVTRVVLALAWSGAILWVTVGSVPDSPLRLPLRVTQNMIAVSPQGWAFFTRDPREPVDRLYRRDAGAWVRANYANTSPRNLFGVRRAARAVNVELAALVALSCVLVVRLQVAVIYFVSATAKLSVPQWANGTALYYWFTHPVFGIPEAVQPLVTPLLSNGWIVTLMTWGVLAFEAVLFAGLFMERRYRPLLLKLGLLFHFGIVLVHGLFSFFFAMAAALVLYLWPVDRPFAFPARIAGRLRRRWPLRGGAGRPAVETGA